MNATPLTPELYMDLFNRHQALQATVEALQARVKELEAIKTPDDAFTYCAYCGEKSPVDEHNEDLAAHIKVCPKHPMRDVESQLTQRTAELERVRGERDHAKKMEAVQKEVADNQTWHVRELRAALDAEREKVKGLAQQVQDQSTANLETMRHTDDMQSRALDAERALAHLQALVRAAASAPGKDWLEWQLKLGEALDATAPAVCPDCNGEGAVDSGGTDQNGNPLMRRCGCREKGGDGE